MAKTPNEIWRDYATDGVPASGLWNPPKADIREWATLVETALPNLAFFQSVAIAEETEIATGVHAINVNGLLEPGDGDDGIYVDEDNGSDDKFTSADGRTWYRASTVADLAMPKTGGTFTGNIAINSTNSTFGLLSYLKGSVSRWTLGVTADSASDYFIHSLNDDGSFREAVLVANWSSGSLEHKGGNLKPANWFTNDVRYFGADPVGSLNSSSSWTATKAVGQNVYVRSGTYKLDTNYDLGTKSYHFERGVGVISPDGSQGRAILNDLGTWDWFDNYIATEDRAILRSPGFAFKADNFVNDLATDHGIATEVMWYNRPAPIPAVGGVMRRMYSQYGSVSSNTQGSFIGNEIEIQIYDADKTGRTFANELNPDAVWAVCQPRSAGNQQGLAIYSDRGAVGPQNDAEVFLAVSTFAVRKHNPVSTLANGDGGATTLGYYGSYGINVVTNPQIGGFGAPQVTTYPLIAMVYAGGFSGPTTATNGTDASATFGAEYAFLAGRHGGQWTNSVTSRSKFNYGIGLEDWVGAAVRIRNMHPSGTGLGIDNPYNTELGGISTDFNNVSLYVKPNDAASSTTARLRIGDWILEQSPDNAGIKNFAFRDLNAGIRWFIGTDGAFYPNTALNIGGAANPVDTIYANTVRVRKSLHAAEGSVVILGSDAFINGSELVEVGNINQQYGGNIFLHQTTFAGSKHTGINFGFQFAAVTDPAANGTDDFAIQNLISGNTPLRLSTNDWLLIRNLNISTLPTSASGLASGDVWRDAAAGNVLKIVP